MCQVLDMMSPTEIITTLPKESISNQSPPPIINGNILDIQDEKISTSLIDTSIGQIPKKSSYDSDSTQHLFVQHPFEFYSAYSTHYENHYSTDHTGFRTIVDYIFYTKEHLHLKGFLSLFKQKDVNIIGSLPNALIPSDHLPLVANFQFIWSS